MPAINKPNQHFDALTYAGSASNQTISGLNFQPDFIWFKERTTGGIDHNLFDSQRSNYGSRLISNAGSAEAASGAIIGVSSTGYSLLGGVSTTNDSSGRTYVTWNWKAGGTAVTNTSGSISSQVSANPTAGFSVVTFTGNGSTGTVGHGLGVAPSMIIQKPRNSTGSWATYHASIGAGNAVWLNLTDNSSSYSTVWNNTAPNSSVYSVGSYMGTSTYVAYCFAPIAGYSAFGSYTGNGSADGPFVYLGFRPRYVMRKKTSGVARWIVEDAARETYNVMNSALSPNFSNAEEVSTANWGIDFLSNGFKIRSTDTESNENGGTFIYMAFAEAPFKFASAR